MVYVVNEVPEAKIPQLLHLPQAERLIVVQIVYLNVEFTGEVPHVSPLLR